MAPDAQSTGSVRVPRKRGPPAIQGQTGDRVFPTFSSLRYRPYEVLYLSRDKDSNMGVGTCPCLYTAISKGFQDIVTRLLRMELSEGRFSLERDTDSIPQAMFSFASISLVSSVPQVLSGIFIVH